MSTQAQAGTPRDFASWREALQRPIPALDGVRGLAILAVLAHQLLVDSASPGPWLRRVLSIPQAGWAGVQLFFVLSGFLITGILLETRSASNRWSSFFMRRALRIFPPYYFLLVLLFGLLPLIMAPPPDFSAGLGRQSWYWLYLANWSLLAGGGVSALAHCWSLSVEEQFYLLWPPVVFALRQRTLVVVCVVTAGAALATRIWIVSSGRNPEYAYELTVARMDALAIGALAAVLVRHPGGLAAVLPRLGRWGWLVLGALLTVGLSSGTYARRNPVTLTLGDTVLALASAWLILVAVRDRARGFGRAGKLLAWAPLCLFGKHSYAIYLFHHPLDMAINRLFLSQAVARMSQWQYLAAQTAYLVLGSGLLLVLAMVFHVAFERPILNLKRYFAAHKKAA